MKRFTCLFLAAFLLLVFWGATDARINPLKQEKLVSFTDDRPMLGQTALDADSLIRVFHMGALWFPAIGQAGFIAYNDVTAYYPGGGDQSLVWQAGMWAGGYVEGNSIPWTFYGMDGSYSDPALYDTFNELGILETQDDLALPYPYRRLTLHVNTDNKVESDDGDMGMDVTFVWHQWGVPGYDHWIIVEVTIEFNKDIEDFWWGWNSDCDVGDVNTGSPWIDDFAGWDETYRFCYMRDWDRDPLEGQRYSETAADSLWLSPSAVGQVLLAAPPIRGDINAAPVASQKWESKNYWDWNNDTSGPADEYDRLSGAWENTFPPEDDFDYRILNGVGPYDVTAGDVAHFWMAYVAGEGYDSDTYATFDMGTLIEHVQDVQDFYDGGFVIPADEIPPREPDLDPDFDVDLSADQLTVHWDPYSDITGGALADSFFVYTSNISKMGPWTRVAAFDNTVTETTVQLPPGFFTYVWVQSYDADNGIGSNPWALTSRLYERDELGELRANNETIVSVIGSVEAEEELDLITVAPNPYIGSNPAELLEYETLIGFHHLPAKCTIYIYNLLGNVVDIIGHDSDSGSEFWDMTTLSGESISSGLYIYRVESADGGEKIGKFAVIKGQR
jgi:hypothetical protein